MGASQLRGDVIGSWRREGRRVQLGSARLWEPDSRCEVFGLFGTEVSGNIIVSWAWASRQFFNRHVASSTCARENASLPAPTRFFGVVQVRRREVVLWWLDRQLLAQGATSALPPEVAFGIVEDDWGIRTYVDWWSVSRPKPAVGAWLPIAHEMVCSHSWEASLFAIGVGPIGGGEVGLGLVEGYGGLRPAVLISTWSGHVSFITHWLGVTQAEKGSRRAGVVDAWVVVGVLRQHRLNIGASGIPNRDAYWTRARWV